MIFSDKLLVFLCLHSLSIIVIFVVYAFCQLLLLILPCLSLVILGFIPFCFLFTISVVNFKSVMGSPWNALLLL